MISTVFAGGPVFLLSAEPEGDIKITVSRLTERHAGRTRREERRALGATLRWKLEYTGIIVDRAAAQAARLALQTFDNRPVLCPFWPGARPYGGDPLFAGELSCTWEPDFAVWELHTGPSPESFTPSAAAFTAPVLWGRFDTFPDPDLITTEVPSIPISFVETGLPTYAIAPATSVTFSNGPVLKGQPWPLIDFDVDYTKTKAGGVDVQIDRQNIGFGRGEAETFYPQTPRSQVEAQAVLSGAEAAKLIAIFHASGATVMPLWFPSAYSPVRLIADATADDVHLHVEDVGALGGHPHIVLRDSITGAVIPRTVLSAAGTILTLDQSPGDLRAANTSLQLLFFGRFLSDDLTLTWTSLLKVAGQFTLTELPPDYGAPAGEIYEVSLGHCGDPIFLFELSDQVGGAWYWTNYESAITVDGHTYEPQKIDWDQISEGINLDDGKTTLTCDSWVGNPLMRLLVPRRGQQLLLVLKEWDASGASASIVLWRCYAMSAAAKGKTLKIPFVSDGRLFDQRVPRRTDGPTCPWIIYGAGCGLTPAAKAVAVTFMYQGGIAGQWRVNIASIPAYLSYFAGGWMQRTIDADDNPTYCILDSGGDAVSGYFITLQDAPTPAPVVGETWTLYPGCAQTWDACSAHGNTAHYGGKPRKPAANPAFVPIQQSTPSTSKK
jgi:Phage conserved hypothetical protein BR0599